MNCAQALAIAAATFVAAGDAPWTGYLANAKSELATLASQSQTRGEAALYALAAEIVGAPLRRCPPDAA